MKDKLTTSCMFEDLRIRKPKQSSTVTGISVLK